jgi:hypothetical protein
MPRACRSECRFIVETSALPSRKRERLNRR